MDEAVVRAMARWPNVPAVYGWLSLSRRGQWLIKGESIANESLRAFISRNYFSEDGGRFAFQNGPQRVYVQLHYTPWVASFDGHGTLRLHTDDAFETPTGVYLDEAGALLLETARGVALLDDRDLDAMSERLAGAAGEPLDDDERERRLEALLDGQPAALTLPFEDRWLAIETLDSKTVPVRFGFEPNPVE